MATTTREQFKQYCLRANGHPVIEINIADEQIEDRIDEALEYWRLYHYEGIEQVYLKHQIKASVLHITTNNGDQFGITGKVTGETSGATAQITTQVDNVKSDGNQIIVRNVEGTFVPGETVSNGTVSAVLADPAVTLGEIDLQYIELPDAVYGVNRMLPFSGTSTSKSMFDLQYQLRLNDLYDLASTSIVYYKQVMNHLSLLDFELNGKPMFDFNRLQSRVYPRINWASDIKPGEFIVLDAYCVLDPTQFGKVWNEPWLKHYGTALIKKAWAINLKKFSGLQLPGGVSLDGQGLYDEAVNEIKDLEDELMNKAAPLSWYMG